MGGFFLISGNEDFSVKERANELIREWCGDPPEEDSRLEIIRGDDDSEKFSIVLDRLLETLETPSFLSPEKIVWLKHFNKFDDAFGESSTKKHPSRMDLLSDFLKNGMPADLTLLIDGAGLDRRKTFFKLSEKVCDSSGGKLEWFDKADPKAKGFLSQLIRKIKEMAMAAGKRMEDNAASYMAETLGSDIARLKNEIDKLAAYTGDRETIQVQDCFEICSRASETLSWEFSSALVERNCVKALSLIPGIVESMEQEKSGSSQPEMAIVGAATAEFKRLFTVKCEGRAMGIPDHASADYFYNLADNKPENAKGMFYTLHPFRAYKLWESACKFSDQELANAFRALLAANKAMVTGESARLSLELLVTKIAGAAE